MPRAITGRTDPTHRACRPRGHTSSRRTWVAAVIAAALLAGLTNPVAASDLDGDGRDELLVGVPDESIGPSGDAGVVHVFRGAASGVGPARSLTLSQRTFGGATEPGDRFGVAIASGDFDGDGDDDLAIGAPAEGFESVERAGVVHVVYGSGDRGLIGRNQLLALEGRLAGTPGDNDFFGTALAVGDFDRDGFDDLVVGAPGKDRARGTQVAAGAVVVVHGSRQGLSLRRSKMFSQAGPTQGSPQSFDAFGVAVAAGDLNGDGFDDIAVGAPGEAIGGVASAGAVHVLFGGSRGIAATGDTLLDSTAAGGAPELRDAFGRSLTIGDLNGDGVDDLIAGAPGDGAGRGSVAVFLGGVTGPTVPGATLVPGVAGVPVVEGTSPRWGWSLAVGDFDGAGSGLDLVVGAPGDGAPGLAGSGSVTVVFGGPAGVPAGGAVELVQSDLRRGASGRGEAFGWALRTGDFDGNGIDDLVVSTPGEDKPNRGDSGVVHVVPGSTAGLAPASAAVLWQGMRGVRERAEAGDRFGSAL